MCAVDAVVRDAVCPSFREVSKEAYSALRPQLQGACGALRMIGLIPLNYNHREALASLDSLGEDIVSEE